MKINEVIEINEYFQYNLYEMSNFFPNDTGLSNGTKLWVRTEPKGLPHVKYRIKLDHPQNGSAVFALWGAEIQQVAGNWKVSGKDLKKIQLLISHSKDALIQHIDGEISSVDLGATFNSVKNKVEKI